MRMGAAVRNLIAPQHQRVVEQRAGALRDLTQPRQKVREHLAVPGLAGNEFFVRGSVARTHVRKRVALTHAGEPRITNMVERGRDLKAGDPRQIAGEGRSQHVEVQAGDRRHVVLAGRVERGRHGRSYARRASVSGHGHARLEIAHQRQVSIQFLPIRSADALGHGLEPSLHRVQHRLTARAQLGQLIGILAEAAEQPLKHLTRVVHGRQGCARAGVGDAALHVIFRRAHA